MNFKFSRQNHANLKTNQVLHELLIFHLIFRQFPKHLAFLMDTLSSLRLKPQCFVPLINFFKNSKLPLIKIKISFHIMRTASLFKKKIKIK